MIHDSGSDNTTIPVARAAQRMLLQKHAPRASPPCIIAAFRRTAAIAIMRNPSLTLMIWAIPTATHQYATARRPAGSPGFVHITVS
jgi:hypothetical protein